MRKLEKEKPNHYIPGGSKHFLLIEYRPDLASYQVGGTKGNSRNNLVNLIKFNKE
jgi:hypothetical protein